MTNQTPEIVIAEVLDEERYYDRSQISNDSRATEIVEALRAANMLREPGVPDAATEELARIKPLFENYSREYPNECNKRVKAEAERDAATAAIERARVEVESINQAAQKSLCGSEPDHAGIYEGAGRALAALDEAPEPEWEYGYRGRYAVMHPTKAGQRIETPEITQRTPDNWLPDMGEIYRRRPSTPAGLWLLVEGESDD